MTPKNDSFVFKPLKTTAAFFRKENESSLLLKEKSNTHLLTIRCVLKTLKRIEVSSIRPIADQLCSSRKATLLCPRERTLRRGALIGAIISALLFEFKREIYTISRFTVCKTALWGNHSLLNCLAIHLLLT